MENPFEAGQEELQHIEHMSASRLKVVITVAILLVTIMTTLTAVMASLWGARESESQRARQQASAEVLSQALHATTRQGALDQQRDDVKEAAWRAVDLRARADLVDQAGLSSSLSSELRRQAGLADALHQKLNAAQPQGARENYDAYTAELRTRQTMAEQRSLDEARVSVAWLDKHNSALAVVSILALSLFLLGLALTLSNRATQLAFTALSIVMLLISGARLGQIAARPVATVSEHCMESYVEGAVANNGFRVAAATDALDRATAACPKYSDAWEQLGYARFYKSISADKKVNTTNLEASQQAFQKALDLAPEKSANLYNALGYVQTLNADYADARTNLDKALALTPGEPTVLGSLAELSAATGDESTAEAQLQTALGKVAPFGSYYRDSYFGSLRLDELIFEIHDYGLYQKLIPFYDKVREAEASIQLGLGTHPGDAHGATVTRLKVARASGAIGKGGAVTISFHYAGLRDGDHLSVRIYQDGVTYELAASEPNILVSQDTSQTPPPGVDDVVNLVGTGREPANNFVRPLAAGNQTVELYVNGVLVARSDGFTMPQGTANGS